MSEHFYFYILRKINNKTLQVCRQGFNILSSVSFTARVGDRFLNLNYFVFNEKSLSSRVVAVVH